MKNLRTIGLLVLLAMGISAWGQGSSACLNREVSLKLHQATRAAVLDSLGLKCGIFFSYNPTLIEAEQLVNVHFDREKLADIIPKLINEQKVAWKAFDNQIVFYAAEAEGSVSRPDSVQAHISIEGRVLENRKDKPIAYCNISVLGTTLGTMSNSEGQFILKIPTEMKPDSIRFSCMGFKAEVVSVETLLNTQPSEIVLQKSSIELKEIDVVHLMPDDILNRFNRNRTKNYESNYVLFTTFYRELVKEDERYTELSEAVIEVLKAPYDNEAANDHVKFVRGRKSREPNHFSEVRFKLKGGPYYITRLDVVKTNETFINPEFRNLYKYSYKGTQLVDDRKTFVLAFEPISNVRDFLYEGQIFIDSETFALVRAEFGLTKYGLREARNVIIEKQPKTLRAALSEVRYVVQYEQDATFWYLKSAQTSMKIRLTDREKKQRTRFHSIAEMVTTDLERGKLQNFARRDIFKANEFITERIETFEPDFWGHFNTIQPETEIQKSLENFEIQNIQNIQNLQP